MAIRSSGTIYMSDINAELGYAYNRNTSLNETLVRQLANINATNSAIGLANFYGVGATAGSWAKGTAGEYTFPVPWYNTMSVDVRGAGGGGEQGLYTVQTGVDRSGLATFSTRGGAAGVGGGASLFNATTQVYGYGGAGGGAAVNRQDGAAGGAAGGSTNTQGGGAGGGAKGSAPSSSGLGGNGGAGGRATITYTRGAAGAPVPYTGIYVVVGAAGAGGGQPDASYRGSNGGVGYVGVSWS